MYDDALQTSYRQAVALESRWTLTARRSHRGGQNLQRWPKANDDRLKPCQGTAAAQSEDEHGGRPRRTTMEDDHGRVPLRTITRDNHQGRLPGMTTKGGPRRMTTWNEDEGRQGNEADYSTIHIQQRDRRRWISRAQRSSREGRQEKEKTRRVLRNA